MVQYDFVELYITQRIQNTLTKHRKFVFIQEFTRNDTDMFIHWMPACEIGPVPSSWGNPKRQIHWPACTGRLIRVRAVPSEAVKNNYVSFLTGIRTISSLPEKSFGSMMKSTGGEAPHKWDPTMTSRQPPFSSTCSSESNKIESWAYQPAKRKILMPRNSFILGQNWVANHMIME